MAQQFPKILTKGYLSSLKNTPIAKEGILRFTLDSRQLFLDNDSTRFEISDFIKDYTETEIRSILAPLPKFYYAKDTHKILYNDGTGWIVVSEQAEEGKKEEIVRGSLAVGATSINLTSTVTSSDDVLVDVYCNSTTGNVAPKTKTFSNGVFTLTFDAQTSVVSIVLKITYI